MKTKSIVVLTLALLSVRVEAAIRCTGTTRQNLTVASGDRVQLPVAAVPGALDYVVQRSGSWTVVPNDLYLQKGEITTTTIRVDAAGVAPRVTETIYNSNRAASAIYYVVTATNSGNFSPCSQDFLVTVGSDPYLAPDAARRVVPVVGSLRGANNSLFRTRVTLENTTNVTLTGALVFRRTQGAGNVALNYSLVPDEVKVYEDVVDAIGAEGLGSLDVVPDVNPTTNSYLAPKVTVYLNSVASSGSFGTNVPAVAMTDREFGAVWTSIYKPSFIIGDTVANRYNLGIRTLGDEVTITGFVFAADGTQRLIVSQTYPADYHVQIPVNSFFGTTVETGEKIQLFSARTHGPAGGAIIYLAATDNGTNDVNLDVATPPKARLDAPFVTCANGSGCQTVLP